MESSRAKPRYASANCRCQKLRSQCPGKVFRMGTDPWLSQELVNPRNLNKLIWDPSNKACLMQTPKYSVVVGASTQADLYLDPQNKIRLPATKGLKTILELCCTTLYYNVLYHILLQYVIHYTMTYCVIFHYFISYYSMPYLRSWASPVTFNSSTPPSSRLRNEAWQKGGGERGTGLQ